MITENNLKDVLRSLGSTEDGDVFQQFIADANLQIDFDRESIIYPKDEELIVNQQQTCNFSQNDNFVVLECVHRPLQQGYKPYHLAIEPFWQVGHGPSGGPAAILVKEQQNNPFLIIECKTPGDEFLKAWEDSCQEGAVI